MNEQRMLAVAEELERPSMRGIQFGMGAYAMLIAPRNWHDFAETYHSTVSQAKHCGAVCCIAGWACLMFGTPEAEIHAEEGQGLLGLTNYQMRRLFYNDEHYIGPYDRLGVIPLDDAVAAIRRMVTEEGNLLPTPLAGRIEEQEKELVMA